MNKLFKNDLSFLLLVNLRLIKKNLRFFQLDGKWNKQLNRVI